MQKSVHYGVRIGGKPFSTVCKCEVDPWFMEWANSVTNVSKISDTLWPKWKHGSNSGYGRDIATKLHGDTPNIDTNRSRSFSARFRRFWKNVHFCSFCSFHEPGGFFTLLDERKSLPADPTTTLHQLQHISRPNRPFKGSSQFRHNSVTCFQNVSKNSDSWTLRTWLQNWDGHCDRSDLMQTRTTEGFKYTVPFQ